MLDGSMRGGQAGHRHPERRTAHVIIADDVAELD